MKHIYLYGASDDCMECDSDFGDHESYTGLEIENPDSVIRVHYVFDGDWGIWLEGEIPLDWIVKSIYANCASEARQKPYGGQFIHIQVPDDVKVLIREVPE